MQLSGDRPKNSDVCDSLLRKLEPSYFPSHLVLDTIDYSQATDVLDEFRDIAFSWQRGQPIASVPQYLAELMLNENCTHLIWLSKRALDLPEWQFTWVLAHECRHVYQSRRPYPRSHILRETQALRRQPNYRNLPPSLFDPAEIDSDIFAYQFVEHLLGETELRRAISQTPLPRCAELSYSAILKEVQLMWQEWLTN